MRKIHNESAHVRYVHDLAGLAFLGDFGAYWLGSVSVSTIERARWRAPVVIN